MNSLCLIFFKEQFGVPYIPRLSSLWFLVNQAVSVMGSKLGKPSIYRFSLY